MSTLTSVHLIVYIILSTVTNNDIGPIQQVLRESIFRKYDVLFSVFAIQSKEVCH